MERTRALCGSLAKRTVGLKFRLVETAVVDICCCGIRIANSYVVVHCEIGQNSRKKQYTRVAI